MNEHNRAVRAMIRNMSPIKAKRILDEIGLPEREYQCILLHDIQQIPIDIVADRLHVSPKTATRIHRQSLKKVYDSVQ